MQPTSTFLKLAPTTQTISFSEGDGVCSAELYAEDVVVSTNSGSHNHGSSKVKLKNLVDYNWEPKYYPGQLLTIHMSGKYLAYSIKAPNTLNPGTWTGMVRVVYNPEPGSDRRALIKGMKGEVQDLGFAHMEHEVVLACIDEQGNLYVYEIQVTDSGLRCKLLAEIREDTGAGGESHRVVWCPYIPDEDDSGDDDVTRLLLTTHGNVGRMWNLRWVAQQLSATDGRGAASALEDGEGVLTVADHTAPLVDASFSPDGTALATASEDGYVMFFQVYMHNEGTPRCLHKWQPHDGQPLSCLFFLDNHKVSNADTHFWKFAVTGAFNNSSLKVWSCKSWSCLQSITFAPAPGAGVGELAAGESGAVDSRGMKALLDLSARYLLLSDYRARTLYVLRVQHREDEFGAYCASLSEFPLPYPVLSFCIADADEEMVKCESRCEDPFHRNGTNADVADSPDHFDLHHDGDREEGAACGGCGEGGGSGAGSGCGCQCTPGVGTKRTRVRLYIVHPKGLQEGELVYSEPSMLAGPDIHVSADLADLSLNDEEPSGIGSSILQQQTQQLKNLLMRSQTQPGSLIVQRPESPSSVPPQLNLMTPDAFSSPGKREEEDPPLSTTPEVVVKQRASTAGSSGGGGAEAAAVVACAPSGGSSPSREVQQIMAHSDTDYNDYMDGESSLTPVPQDNTSMMVQNGSESIYQDDDMYVSTDKQAAPLLNNTGESWPPMPLMKEARQRLASSDKSSGQSLNASLNVSAVTCERAASPVDRARFDALDQKIDSLTELVRAQSRELSATRAALQAPHAALEATLEAHEVRAAAAVQNALAEGWDRVLRASEAASARAAHAAGAGAARALEPLAVALQHELASKLSATDRLLRDNIDKLVNSKTIMERLSTSIATSLAEMVRNSFKEAILQTVVPLLQSSQAELLKQLSQTYINGTKELAENTATAARAAAERGGALAVTSLRTALERHSETLTSAAAAANAAPRVADLQPQLKELVHGVVEKELSWWREQTRAVCAQMSRAHSPSTPASHLSQDLSQRQMQVAQIQALMGSGDVNGAFQLALSASDLSLVVAACRAAEPAAAVAALKQHVLLSLVQQLAADMTRDTHLKHRYLEEAIMNLDPSNPVTREHLPNVVHELKKQIVSFLNSNPGHALSRQFRMLLLATEAFTKSTV